MAQLAGTTSPNLTVNAYKSSRFGGSGNSTFPASGAAPLGPDATATASGTGAWTLVTPTNEDYVVAYVSGTTVQGFSVYPYVPMPGQLLQNATGTAGYTSPDLPVGNARELAVDFNLLTLSGGTSPTVTYKLSRKEADGTYYALDTPATIAAAGVISKSYGPGGQINVSLGLVVQVQVVVTGAPTITWSLNVTAK